MRFRAKQDTPLFPLLCEQAAGCSRNTVRSWLKWGRICVQGEIVQSAQFLVKGGEEVVLQPKKEVIEDGIELLYEDQALIALVKPPGLLSVADDLKQERSVHEILKQRRRRVFPVHRLDRETSGVMLFACTLEARLQLKEQFEKRLVEKCYYAIVEGEPAKDRGTWESHLEEGSDLLVRPVNKGKYARTEFVVVHRAKGYALLELRPVTGRKHQLRVHCQQAGLCIAGDAKYGAKTDPIHRVALHAARIAFAHPSKGVRKTFEAPLPRAFRTVTS